MILYEIENNKDFIRNVTNKLNTFIRLYLLPYRKGNLTIRQLIEAKAELVNFSNQLEGLAKTYYKNLIKQAVKEAEKYIEKDF